MTTTEHINIIGWLVANKMVFLVNSAFILSSDFCLAIRQNLENVQNST